MNFFQKLNTKNIFRYIYIAVLIINIVALYFLFSFNKERVYSTIYLDEAVLTTQATRGVGNINVKMFDEVADQINKKKIH